MREFTGLPSLVQPIVAKRRRTHEASHARLVLSPFAPMLYGAGPKQRNPPHDQNLLREKIPDRSPLPGYRHRRNLHRRRAVARGDGATTPGRGRRQGEGADHPPRPRGRHFGRGGPGAGRGASRSGGDKARLDVDHARHQRAGRGPGRPRGARHDRLFRDRPCPRRLADGARNRSGRVSVRADTTCTAAPPSSTSSGLEAALPELAKGRVGLCRLRLFRDAQPGARDRRPRADPRKDRPAGHRQPRAVGQARRPAPRAHHAAQRAADLDDRPAGRRHRRLPRGAEDSLPADGGARRRRAGLGGLRPRAADRDDPVRPRRQPGRRAPHDRARTTPSSPTSAAPPPTSPCSTTAARASTRRAPPSAASAPWSRPSPCAPSGSAAIPRLRWKPARSTRRSCSARAACCRCRSSAWCMALPSPPSSSASCARPIRAGSTAASRCAPACRNASPPASPRRKRSSTRRSAWCHCRSTRCSPRPRRTPRFHGWSRAASSMSPASRRPTPRTSLPGNRTGMLSAARLGAELFARRRDGRGQAIAPSAEAFSERVLVALTRQSAEVILETAFAEDGLDGAATVAHALVQRAVDANHGIARLTVALDRPVIGLGASALAPLCRPAAAGRQRLRRAIRRRRRQCARRRRRPGARLRRSDDQPACRGHLPPLRRRRPPRDFGDEDQALGEGEARIRAIVAERALAAGTDTAEIDIESDVMASIVEGQRMFIEARLVAIASGRPEDREMDANSYSSPARCASWRRFWRGRGPICWITSPAASEPRSPQCWRSSPAV